MKRSLIVVLVIALFLGTVNNIALGKTVTIEDVQEQTVTVPQPTNRIVSISGALTEMLVVLGVEDRIVGRDQLSEFPEVLKTVPVVAENSFRPQLEAILELKPDLVIADGMLSADNRAKLESFGIPVVVERGTDPTRLFAAIRNLALVTGTVERGEEIIAFIAEYENLILDRVGHLSEEDKPRVYWEWNAPFKSGSKTSTTGPRILLAGGINIAEDAAGTYPVLSAEYVWEQDPEVIIKMSSQTDTPEMAVERHGEIRSRLGISETSAVANERVHIISWTINNGIRSIISSLHYAKWFHPELFADLEPEEIHGELLAKFYNINLGDLEPTIYP